jgi:two-component system phosphate regulon sensor histidine kinase PhoR
MGRRRIIGIFLMVICVCAATIVALGWRLLDQDRILEAQYRRQRLDEEADRSVRLMEAALSDETLFQRPPGEGALLATYPDGRMLFRPDASAFPEAAAAAFERGEALEQRDNDLGRAAQEYRTLTTAKDRIVQTGAWARLARTLRKARDYAGALAAYDQLGRFENAAAAGWPATLAALWGRCSVLDDLGKKQELRECAVRLRLSLDQGRWPLARSDYEIFADDAERWSGDRRPRDEELLTEAANELWQRIRRGEAAAEGRTVVRTAGEPVTLLWKAVGKRTAVLAASKSFVERTWLRQAGQRVWLRDEPGLEFPVAPAEMVVRYPGETRLPWALAVAAPEGSAPFASRRKLLMLLLATVALFTVAGGYFCLRALRREFALSRIQSDFVAAVSHEFRTPLTSMRLITEALEDDRIPDRERLRESYHALARATSRLQRLVEDLLDFRRMESGAVEYRMRPMDAGDTVRAVTDEFKKEVEARGFRLHVRVEEAAPILADEGALSRAVWNLLDNAAKYSGDSRDIEVALHRAGSEVAVAVRDRGIGITPEEKAQLFAKFYRGEAARRSGIRGTGIGLAMVAQIVAAHGGKISVQSEPGCGSTFTMSLPLEKA